MKVEKIAQIFAGDEKILSCVPYGNGHINDTYKVETRQSSFVLQRINRHVFVRPDQVMENLTGVTNYIAEQFRRDGIDPEGRVLHVVRTADGRTFHIDEYGEYWRACSLVTGAVCYERAETEAIFRESAVAFGYFQYLLREYPVRKLHETIAGFHDTPMRLKQFRQALEQDAAGRAWKVREESAFLLEHAGLAGRLQDAYDLGDLPLRVTHNDTKLNNVLINETTGRWMCVLDLDTVMPGFSALDFGDAIRFGASTGAEDEPDLDKVHFDRHLYEVYREGFLEGCRGALTKTEEEMLPDGALVITYEQALRFLADYLAGDVYYKTAREEHNLDRARTQIRLLEEMEEQLG